MEGGFGVYFGGIFTCGLLGGCCCFGGGIRLVGGDGFALSDLFWIIFLEFGDGNGVRNENGCEIIAIVCDFFECFRDFDFVFKGFAVFL